MTKAIAISIEVRPPLRDVRGRFARANAKLLADQRKALGDDLARLRDLARDEAPKRTGAFAKGIGYRTKAGAGANSISGEVVVPMPLGRWIIGGTRPHLITPRNKQALFWEGLAHPVMFANHPGTKPNKFTGRAYRRWLPGARASLNALGRSWSAEVRKP